MSVSRKEWFEGIAALRCALVLALGAPLLGGCAASHVGSAWQCPLVQGQPCVSVAEVDPAGAGARQAGAREGNTVAVPVSETPLYRTESVTKDEANDTAAEPPRTGCRGGCRPFAWLRRLGRHGTGAPLDAGAGEADTDTGEPGEALEMRHTETSTVLDPKVGDLRTPEVIGRIWIAPYVDAHGVYHEASWVRVVFEPAGWKHP